MASKAESYQRIIALLQADISLHVKAISDLQSTVSRQQKEIEALKASQDTPKKSPEPQQKRITTENLLLAVKRVCDDVIRANNEQLPTMFADRKEFQSFRNSAEQKFLSADTFIAYQKSQETRLKFIEEKNGQRYSLLTIDRYYKNGNSESKSYISFDTIIREIMNSNLQWLKPIIVCLTIFMLALFLIRGITT